MLNAILLIAAGGSEVIDFNIDLVMRMIIQSLNLIILVMIPLIITLLIILMFKGIKALNIYIRKNKD